MKGLISGVVLVTVALALPQARAADQVRAKWKFDNGQSDKGHFAHQSGKDWAETQDNGFRAKFCEVERNADYIELYDNRRDIAVRLYKTRMYLKQPGEKSFTFFRNGYWE